MATCFFELFACCGEPVVISPVPLGMQRLRLRIAYARMRRMVATFRSSACGCSPPVGVRRELSSSIPVSLSAMELSDFRRRNTGDR